MTPKKLQKAFNISSEQSKIFIDKRIEDIATEYNKSTSFVIEETLINALLPKHHQARYLIYNFLYKDIKHGVRNTLDSIFAWNNAGIDWNSKYDNLRPLVEFSLFNIDGDPILPKDDITMHSFLYSLNSLIRRAEKELDSFDNIIDKSQYQCSFDYAKTLYAQAQDTTTDVGIKIYFEVILDLWEIIKGWAMTYRALSALAAMSTFREDATTRNALVDLIDQISKQW
ncbi:MAG: hypothetical protein IJ871_02075 [Ruminococcus sp.]|nr:hypothetical protein [Ruminococcus sp.]